MNTQKSLKNHRTRSLFSRSFFTILLAFLMAFSAVAPSIPAQAASGNMQITPIDYGSADNVWGDSTMVSSGGKNLLMDTFIRDKYDTLINYLDDHHFYTFDIYLSHYHWDHMDQISTIIADSRFNVGKVYLPDPAYLRKGAQSSNYCQDLLDGHDDIVSTANRCGCQVVYLKKGSSFTIGSATANVLWGCSYSSSNYDAAYINNNSLVTKITSGTASYLTCGDIERETENQIVGSGVNISADIFKFNHHGGNSSNTAAFVKKVNPSFAYENCMEESPSSFGGGWVQTAIDNLKNTCNIYSTRYNGMLTFTVKAGHISVAGERNMNSVNVQIKDSSGSVVNTVNYQFNNALDYHITSAMKSTAASVAADDASTALPERYASVAKFIETSGGVKFRNKDGSYSTNKFQDIYGDTYYFDENGYRVTGFRKINGKTYYFDSEGKMLLRWKRINGKKYLFDPVDGHMHTGWEWVSEKNAWYYLSPSTGYLLENWQFIDGKWYYLTLVDYYAKTGWQYLGGKWYFFDKKNCDMKTGWLTDGGKTYYLNKDGAMVTGTQNIDGRTYTFNSSGALVGQAPSTVSGSGSSTGTSSSGTSGKTTGWVQTGGKWYYLQNGTQLKGCFRKIDGQTYYFNDSGVMLLRWKRIDGKKYLFDPVDGHMHTGWEWVSENSAWYYLSPDKGYLLEGWLDYGGKKYYLTPVDFYAKTGWQYIEGKWYFFDKKNCDMKTGWLTDGGKTYYLNKDGVMVTGTQSIDGKTYTFNSSGALVGQTSSGSGSGTSSGTGSAGSYGNTTGWVQTGGKWYYLQNGTPIKNCFKTIGSATYYLDESGVMLTGFQKIGGKTYYFDSSGSMLLRWKRIDGRKYYFDPVDGHMHTGWEWVEENKAWYYLSPDTGYLLEGWLTEGGKKYYLTPVDFYAKTGWQYIDNKWYFFDKNNAYMKTGWLTDGGKTYYLREDGVMVTGTQSIDGKTYTFNSSGALVGQAPSGTTGSGSTGSSSTSSAAAGSSAWNLENYATSSVTSSWAKGSDNDMPLDYTTKRNTAFVNTMLSYATYFVDKIDYASSVTNNDPTGLRFLRLKSGGKTDCSWFVYHVLYKFGLVGEEFIHSYEWGNDPSTYPGAVNIGTDMSKASPGDIICTGRGTQSSNSHVMIYLGGNKVVECAAGYGVIISTAPSSPRQIVHFNCLPVNTSAPYRSTTYGSWESSGSSWKFKVGGTYLTNRFQNVDGEIYYFGSDGLCAIGWRKIEGKWYCFKSGGQMYLRWKRINGKKYYFDPITGYMHTGWEWVSEQNGWYYLDPSEGYLVSGWKTIDGDNYYFNSDGKMLTGRQTIDGTAYNFASNGALQN